MQLFLVSVSSWLSGLFPKLFAGSTGWDAFPKAGMIAGVGTWGCKFGWWTLDGMLITTGMRGSWFGWGCCTRGYKLDYGKKDREPQMFSDIISIYSSINLVSLARCPLYFLNIVSEFFLNVLNSVNSNFQRISHFLF